MTAADCLQRSQKYLQRGVVVNLKSQRPHARTFFRKCGSAESLAPSAGGSYSETYIFYSGFLYDLYGSIQALNAAFGPICCTPLYMSRTAVSLAAFTMAQVVAKPWATWYFSAH